MSEPDYFHFLGETRVEELMAQAMPWNRILKVLAQEGLTKYPATAKEWRDKVLARWAQEEDEARPHRKAIWRTRLENLYYELSSRALGCKNDGAAVKYFQVALQAADACIALDGVSAPIQVQHGGSVGVGVDVRAMLPVDREREIAELLERRRIAQAKPVLTIGEAS